MKKTFVKAVSVILSLIFIFSLASCGETNTADLWESAVYTENTELGEGAKTVTVEVKAAEKSVIFTVHTDKGTLGDALLEYELIDGEEGAYGLYVKKVNGIVADYDIDQSYWAFYIDGETAMTGVDGAEIDEGAEYKLEYTK